MTTAEIHFALRRRTGSATSGELDMRILILYGLPPLAEATVAPLDILSEQVHTFPQAFWGNNSTMPDSSIALLQGSLDLLVLKTLTWQPMHGFGIARWIQRLTDDALQVEEGSLYPALYRLENRGLVKAEWALTENKRRAKYYRLTAAGRKRLAEEAETWRRFSTAIGKVLQADQQPA